MARIWATLISCAAACNQIFAIFPFRRQPIGTVGAAVKDMMKDKSLLKKHGEKALAMGLCTAKNLQECSGFCNRVGWKLAFLESPLLDGMLAARYMKGQAAKIRQEMLRKARKRQQSWKQLAAKSKPCAS